METAVTMLTKYLEDVAKVLSSRDQGCLIRRLGIVRE